MLSLFLEGLASPAGGREARQHVAPPLARAWREPDDASARRVPSFQDARLEQEELQRVAAAESIRGHRSERPAAEFRLDPALDRQGRAAAEQLPVHRPV